MALWWKGSGRARDLAYRRGGELFGQPQPTGAKSQNHYLVVGNPLVGDMQIACRLAFKQTLVSNWRV